MASGSAARQAVAARAGIKGRASNAILRQKKFIIGGAAVLLAIGYLVFHAMQGTTMYYLTVAELRQKAAAGTLAPAEQVRVSGVVVDGSVQSDPKTNTTRFEIADRNGDQDQAMPVVYKGVVPDAFKPGGDAVIEGTYSSNGGGSAGAVTGSGEGGEQFVATTLLAKCPSKYVPAGN